MHSHTKNTKQFVRMYRISVPAVDSPLPGGRKGGCWLLHFLMTWVDIRFFIWMEEGRWRLSVDCWPSWPLSDIGTDRKSLHTHARAGTHARTHASTEEMATGTFHQNLRVLYPMTSIKTSGEKGCWDLHDFSTPINHHSHVSWDESKNPYPLRNHIIPNSATPGGSRNHSASDLMVPGPWQLPRWELCDFSVAMGL